VDLETAVKVFVIKYESKIDIELAEEIRATKADDKLAEALAKGGLAALRSLWPSIRQIHYALYPSPEERLAFILEPLNENNLENIRRQVKTLKANEQYRAIGLLAQRALDFWEEDNGRENT